MEKQVRKAALLQEKLDRIMEINSGIIYVLDAQGRFTFVNKAVKAILHYEPEELIGRHFSLIMSRAEFERVGRDCVLPRYQGKVTGEEDAPKLFDERRSGMRRTRGIEVELLTKEKRDVRVLRGDVTGMMGSEGYYGEGAVQPVFLGSQGIIFDVTKFRELEQERKELEQKFYDVQKYNAIGRLAGGAAHHFNNKLGAILGYAELIRQKGGSDGPETVRYLDFIISSTKQCAKLTNQLLTFARQGSYLPVPLTINDVVRDVCQFLSSTVRHDIRIAQKLDARNPVIVGDPADLRNAFLDVGMNGCDAMPHGGDLSFETRIVDSTELREPPTAPGKHGDGKYVVCSVADTGIGMDEAVKSKIFEPFFTTKEVGQGMGMGLACVYGCVTNHHGFIDVASSLGKGTRFDIYLPYAGENVTEGAGGMGGGAEMLRGTGQILVINDDTDICRAIRDQLAAMGYQATALTSSGDAVDYYTEHCRELDLVIIDISLPNSRATELFAKLRTINPQVTVIGTTGFSLSDEVDSLLREGVYDFITKPFDIVQLSHMVHRALQTKQRRV
jgi:PAS domain S-box-containing protein